MPEVLDWQRADPRVVLQRAVQELSAGRLVVFPTDTGYHVAASALDAEALLALSQLSTADDAVLAVRDVAHAVRWAPWLSNTARRLARRCWPDPVTLLIEHQSSGAGGTEGPSAEMPCTVRLRVPAHEAPLAALDQLDAPLVLVPAGRDAAAAGLLVEPLGEHVAVLIADDPAGEPLNPTVVRVQDAAWSVTQVGSISDEMLRGLMPTTILFVCTGNTCRSPLAEALCKKMLAERLGCPVAELPQRGFLVLSAGLAAMMGAEASPEAVEVARECGADLSGHRSQPLSAELLARADYLFAMTQSHLRALVPYCDPSGPQPRLLAREGCDVPDPIGAERQVYRDCAQQILRHLQDCLPEIEPL